MTSSFGFIGGGRITKILLKALSNSGISLSSTTVSDTNAETLNALKSEFPEIKITPENIIAAKQDNIFISLHPPVIAAVLSEIMPELNSEKTLISLAPKLSIAKLSMLSGGITRIIRMIPNAPTIVNAGFNPLSFSSSFTTEEKNSWNKCFTVLGECPEVEENKLEMYAILTAMGPTYFNFQIFELLRIIEEFGLGCSDAKSGLTQMFNGMMKLMNSNYSPAEIMDLIPVKPLGDKEEIIKAMYSEKLIPLFQKIKPE